MLMSEYYKYKKAYQKINPKHLVGKHIGSNARFLCLFSYNHTSVHGKPIKPYFTNNPVFATRHNYIRW